MHMQSRACVGKEIGVLDDQEVACCVGGGDLKGEMAETEGMEMTGAILAGGDGMDGGVNRRFG